MTNPLQDKRIVSILALAAVLTVGWRVQGLSDWFFPPTTVDAAELSPPPTQLSPPSPAKPTEKIDATNPTAQRPTGRPSAMNNLVHWQAMFTDRKPMRDPFGPLIESPKMDPLPDLVATLAHEDSMVLQAVSIEPRKAFAVINHQVLAEGQPIGEFQVERIRSNEVWLKHANGRRVLRLEFATPQPIGISPDPETPPSPNQPPRP